MDAIKRVLLRLFTSSQSPVEITVERLDSERVLIRTTRGDEVHETVAHVFTEEEMGLIREAKENIQRSTLAQANTSLVFAD